MPAGSPPLRLQLRKPLFDLIVAMQRLEILQGAGILNGRAVRHAGDPTGRVQRLLDLGVRAIDGAVAPADDGAVRRHHRGMPQIAQPVFRFAPAGAHGVERRFQLLDLALRFHPQLCQQVGLRLDVELARDAGLGQIVAAVLEGSIDALFERAALLLELLHARLDAHLLALGPTEFGAYLVDRAVDLAQCLRHDCLRVRFLGHVHDRVRHARHYTPYAGHHAFRCHCRLLRPRCENAVMNADAQLPALRRADQPRGRRGRRTRRVPRHEAPHLDAPPQGSQRHLIDAARGIELVVVGHPFRRLAATPGRPILERQRRGLRRKLTLRPRRLVPTAVQGHEIGRVVFRNVPIEPSRQVPVSSGKLSQYRLLLLVRHQPECATRADLSGSSCHTQSIKEYFSPLQREQ